MKKQSIISSVSVMIVLAMAVLMCTDVYASSVSGLPYWTNINENNDFAESGNWLDGDDNPVTEVPGDREINLAGEDKAVLDGDDVGGDRLFVGFGENQVGELEIQSGEISVGSRYGQTHIGRYSGSEGTINHYGGTVNSYSQNTGVRLGRDHGSGVYNQYGGRFYSHRNPGVVVGHSGDGSSEYNLYGGEFELNSQLLVGIGQGRFMVSGSDASFIKATEYDQRSQGTLRFEFDDSDGVTPIEVAGDVSFDSGALLEVDWEDAPVFGTWTVMTWSGDISGENNLAFAGGIDTDIWSFDFNSGSLSVTAIPEPSSLVLLGIAGLLLMKRRRV